MAATVDVDLVASGDSWSVEFTGGGNVTVGAGDVETISWVLNQAPLGAAITAVTINPGQPNNVPWMGAEPSAPDWTTTDQNEGVDEGVTWQYVVTVTYRNTAYNHDPQITNDPPTMISRRRRS